MGLRSLRIERQFVTLCKFIYMIYSVFKFLSYVGCKKSVLYHFDFQSLTNFGFYSKVGPLIFFFNR